jgi:hypothetical protein
MPVRVLDDGSTLTLDLHGASVEDAERLVRRAVSVGASRGRHALRIIHGASTSDRRVRNPTIKHRVEDLLAAGLPGAGDFLHLEGATTVSLTVGKSPDRRRITLADLW